MSIKNFRERARGGYLHPACCRPGRRPSSTRPFSPGRTETSTPTRSSTSHTTGEPDGKVKKSANMNSAPQGLRRALAIFVFVCVFAYNMLAGCHH